MIEFRPWGYFRVLYNNDGVKLKQIYIKNGHRLSLQKHEHRNEFWVVAQGSAIVEVNGFRRQINEGDNVLIRKKDVHRVEAITNTIIIELQYGDKLDEHDIIRIEDDYGRT